MAEILDRLDELETRAGADEEAIRVVEESLGRKLPSEYRAFLLASDGAYGFVGEEYVHLYPVGELLEANAESEVECYWPGFTLFGSNGGADGFGFVWEDGRVQYVRVPLIGFEKEYAVKSEHLWAVLLGDADVG